MKFAAHYLPTYIPKLDGTVPEFYRRMLEQFEHLDRLGFHQVWVTEHHFHEYGGTVPDPSTFLSAAASRTSRIRLGIAIVVLPLYHPLKAAESFGMVDVLSNGRLDFGLGRGTAVELEQFGIGYEESGVRMREAIEVLQQAWSEETVDFNGSVFDMHGMRVLPKPVQRPHPPIWVAASRSDDTYRWAGQQGFNLLTLPSLNATETLLPAIGHYREELERAGHDPSTREVLGKFHIYVTEDDALGEAGEYLENYWQVSADQSGPRAQMRHISPAEEIAKGTVIAGTPERCIEVIRHWQDTLGLTVVSGTFFFGGLPQELALRNIALFAEEVMPAFAPVQATA